MIKTTRYAVLVPDAQLVGICLVGYRESRYQEAEEKRTVRADIQEATVPPLTHTHITTALMVMYARKPARVSDG